jgi:hypothetical protein
MSGGWKGWWNEWARLNGNELSWIAVIVVLMLLVVLSISPTTVRAQVSLSEDAQPCFLELEDKQPPDKSASMPYGTLSSLIQRGQS